MCYIPFDRLILQLSNGIKYVMPSTDRKLELTAKASMAQSVSQPAVCSNGLITTILQIKKRLCVFFWVSPRRQILVSRRFGTLCRFQLQGLQGP
jgi:hypothetical protein